MSRRLSRGLAILAVVFLAGVLALVVRWASERGRGTSLELGASDLVAMAGEATSSDAGVSISEDGASAYESDIEAQKAATADSLWTVDVNSAFAATRGFALQAGSYSVTVSYASSADAGVSFYNGWAADVVADNAVASSANTSLTLEATALQDQSSAVIYFYSNGGAMSVSRVSITPTCAWADGRLLEGLVAWVIACYVGGLLAHVLRAPRIDLGGRRVLVILAATVAFACLPLCVDTILADQDMGFHLMRIEGIYRGLLAGEFPVRVYPSLLNGNGYASGVMYGDVLLYLPALLRVCGLSLQLAYKVFAVAVTALTCGISYWSLKRMFSSRRVATFGSAVYLLSAYRITNVFVRAAVGEYCAMAFLPLVIYGFWHILTADTAERSYRWAFAPLAIGLSGLLLTHILSFAMAGLFLVIAAIVFCRCAFSWPRLREYLKAIAATAAWCLWFLVPFVTFMVQGVCGVGDTSNAFDLHNSAAFFAQLVAVVSPGTGISNSLAGGMSGEMPLGVGVVLVILAVTLVFVAVDVDLMRANRGVAAIGITCCSLGALAVWLSSDLFPWDAVARNATLSHLFGTLQFAWRFLSPATALLTVGGMAALYLLWRSKPAWAKALVVGLACLSVVSAGYTYNSLVQEEGYKTVMSGASFNTLYGNVMWGEYLPRGTTWGVTWNHTEPVYSDGITPVSYEKTDAETTVGVANTTSSDATVTLPLLDYPGYVATDVATGRQLTVSKGVDGELAVSVPVGWSGTFVVSYQGLWFWHVADAASVAVIVATAVMKIRSRHRHTDVRAEVPTSV